MLSIWRAESFLPSMTSSGSDSSYLGRDYSSQFTHTLTPLCTLKKKKMGGGKTMGEDWRKEQRATNVSAAQHDAGVLILIQLVKQKNINKTCPYSQESKTELHVL